MNSEIKKQRLQDRLGPEIKDFRNSRQTLQLATVSKSGLPNVSYTPFVLLDDGYYILISQIATHATNLLENPVLSIMMIEDENSVKMVHARKRLSYDANASVVPRDSEKWQQAITALHTRFGEIIKTLSSLQDFKLFQLKPISGLYVKGFGKAFQVSCDDLINILHLNEGHQKVKESKKTQGAELK